MLPVFLAAFFVSLYAFSCLTRSNPAIDYANVYDSAYNLVNGGEVDWFYQSVEGHRYGLHMFMAGAFSLGNLIGADGYYIMLLFNTAL